MTLEEIADSLPNGFHDTQINSIRIDYVNREITLDVEIWVGDSSEDDSDVYRPAQLTLLRFLFCVIEAPDATYPYHEEKALWVDAGSEETPRIATGIQLPEPLPKGAFTHWFFVNDWNAFIHVAAMDAHISLM